MAAMAQTAMANSGKVDFEGAITAVTCTVHVNGALKDGLVRLPTVSSSLLDASGKTTGRTFIKFELSGCTPLASGSHAKVFFTAGSTINTDGRLDNTETTGAATNVNLQILDTYQQPIDLTSDATNQSKAPPAGATPNSPADISTGKATMLYAVQYYATGTSTPGSVKSSVGYEINYE